MESVCRTCLRIIGSDYSSTFLNQPKQGVDAVTVRQKLEACVPELTVDIVLEPTICGSCTATLNQAYKFKSICLETEKTLFKCIRRRRHSTHCTDLLTTTDLLKISRKDINEEHSYSYIDKTHDYITDSDRDEEVSLSLPTIVRSTLGAFVEQANRSKSMSPQKASPEAAKLVEKTKLAAKRNVVQGRGRPRKTAKVLVDEKASPKRSESKVRVDEKASPKRKESKVLVDEKASPKRSESKVRVDEKASPKRSESKVRFDETASPKRSSESKVLKESQKDKDVIQGNKELKGHKHEIRKNKELKKHKQVKLHNGKAPKELKTVEVRNSQKVEATVPKERKDKKFKESRVTKDSKQSPKANNSFLTPIRNGGKERKRKNLIKSDKNGYDTAPAPHFEFLETIETFSSNSTLSSSIQSSINKIVDQMQVNSEEVVENSGVTDDDKCEPAPAFVPVENNVKRKQRKQARPKKKPMEELNKEEDIPKIVSYPRLCKMSPRLFSISKQTEDESPGKDGNKNIEEKQATELQSEESVMKQATIKNDIKPKGFAQPPDEDNHQDANINNSDNPTTDTEVFSPGRLNLIKDMPIFALTNRNWTIGLQGMARIRDKAIVKSDVVESLNPVWYTTEKKRYQCTKCSKGYNYKCHFDVHLKSHIFKKLYSCPICDKSFTQEKYLKTHASTHAKTGMYECEVCHKKLSASTALKRHIRTHTGEKPYSCCVCSKSFAQKIQLAVHMRTHTGYRPFSCNVCSASFTQKSHLLGHTRIHTGEKPFACDICPKRFRKSYALQIHQESHSQKPYQCKGCNHLFKDRGTYQRHINKQLLNCVKGRASMLKSRKRSPNESQRRSGLKRKRERPAKDEVDDDFRKVHLFYCNCCNRGFSTKFSRDRHMRVHIDLLNL